MTVSAARTVILPASSGRLSSAGRGLQWPIKQSGELLDFSADASAPMAGIGSSIASMAWSVSPDEDGVLAVSDLAVVGSTLTGILGLGVPGRGCDVMIKAQAASGQEFTWIIGLQIALGTARRTPRPINPTFTAPVTCSSGVTVFGPAIANVMDGLVATGTNLATALVLPAQTNIFASAPAGTSAVLPLIGSGTIVVIAGNDNVPIRPPSGARINSLDIDEPITVFAHQRMEFATRSATTKWTAS